MAKNTQNKASETPNDVDVSDLTIEARGQEEAYLTFREHSQRMKATRIRTQPILHKLLDGIKFSIWTATPVHLRGPIDLDDVGLCPERQKTLDLLSHEERERVLELVFQELLVELLLRSNEEKECYCCTITRMADELMYVVSDIAINHKGAVVASMPSSEGAEP